MAGLKRRSDGRASEPRTDSTHDESSHSGGGGADAPAAVQSVFTHAGPTVGAGPIAAEAGVVPGESSRPAAMKSAFTNAVPGGQVRLLWALV